MNKMKFTEYCDKNGIKLLREDLKYLRKMTEHLTEDVRKRVLKRYADIWLSTIRESENASHASNLGRKAANLRLPRLIEVIQNSKNWNGKIT